MRRKDREMSREFALAVMDKCEWTVVSFVTPEGEPYAVPVSAVREGDTLSFHTAKEGRKIDCIAHSPLRARRVRRRRGEGEGQVHHGV